MKRISLIGLMVFFCMSTVLKAENYLEKAESGSVTEVKIFPNPATNESEVTLVSDRDFEKIEIVSIVGSIVYFEELQPTPIAKINISRLDKGIYFVKITYTDNTGDIQRIWVK